MNQEITITITVNGPLGSGKSIAIRKMVDSLKNRFEFTAQIPLGSLFEVETYTFKARMK